MEHEERELIAGYLLDALASEERTRFERHLEECARCRAELAELRPVTVQLAVAASGPVPPARLRERILDAARSEAEAPALPRRSQRASRALVAVAAAAVAAAAAVGVWASGLRADLDAARQALERERDLTAVLADPRARSVALAAGEGRLVVSPDGQAVLVLPGLPPIASGSTYQLWVVPGGDLAQAAPAGLLDGSAPTDVALVRGRVARGDVVAVTVEVAGGVSAPTSDPIVVSEPA
ncbi:MAG: anti-sigma factor [Gaiellaceae bacterium]|nr:anti-sigma factor [Gaiellaceae bacterium]